MRKYKVENIFFLIQRLYPKEMAINRIILLQRLFTVQHITVLNISKPCPSAQTTEAYLRELWYTLCELFKPLISFSSLPTPINLLSTDSETFCSPS